MKRVQLQSGSAYDLIVVGTGFAGSFFLHRWLEHAKPGARVLVMEAGSQIPHQEQLRAGKALHLEASTHFHNETPEKPWNFTRHLGGGSNCWFGTTPRMLPEDFELASRFGVGTDWPLRYAELEPYYGQAEQLMRISGDSEASPVPRSTPYPLPPHRMSEPEQILRRAHPSAFFSLPTARARIADQRGVCCNNGVCSLCPVDAKFTLENGMPALFADPRVELALDCRADHLELQGSVARGVHAVQAGREVLVGADLVVLGANGLFNPFILLKSGLSHSELGRGLCEQVGLTVMVELADTASFLGSTITTGMGVGDLRSSERRERAGFMFQVAHRPLNLSLTRGRWFNTMEIIVVIEDLRQARNRVRFDPSRPDRPVVEYHGHSAYAQRTVERMPGLLEPWLQPLSLASIQVVNVRQTESHVQCTSPMGTDPVGSVVDGTGLLHTHRNVAVLGSGNFPTASPANPSLTVAALSLRAADRLAR